MPTIVDMRPSANTFRHATLIVIWLDVVIGNRGRLKLYWAFACAGSTPVPATNN